MKTFSIYGDNIVECERMLSLLRRSLRATHCSAFGTAVAPAFQIESPLGRFVFYAYPGFGRWEHDLIVAMKNSGGILRETPDVFITAVESGLEVPVLAIEFCSALPAGNQAWQRSGRAYSTARCGIPYLFVTEIGGYELDSDREKKAPRLPNPAVPFSYISYAISSCSDVMIAYEMNPGADDLNRTQYASMVAGRDLLKYIAAKLIGNDSSETLESMGNKVFSFVRATSQGKRSSRSSLDSTQWESVYRSLLQDRQSAAIYQDFQIPWKKKLSIPIKPSFRRFLEIVEGFAIAVGSGDLPFCVVRKESINVLKAALKTIYPKFFALIPESQFGLNDIAICWINGFKPRGDDARPDRGLLPLLRMLVGDNMPILTVVYGPATRQVVAKLASSPRQLAEDNGLWEVVLALSNFAICDSMRADGYVCQMGWGDSLAHISMGAHVSIHSNDNHFPLSDCIGENDVDSVIHMLFAHVLSDRCFESMCNPPGGDWSGISLMIRNKEYRWLTLPRVSASGSKRPDHVIEVNENLVITIESKDYLRNLERGIGPRLNQYCVDLFASQPSCVREPGHEWNDHTDGFLLPEITYVSVGAFIENAITDRDVALAHAKTDVIFLISFSEDEAIIRIKFSPSCNSMVRDLLSNIEIPDNLKIKIDLIN